MINRPKPYPKIGNYVYRDENNEYDCYSDIYPTNYRMYYGIITKITNTKIITQYVGATDNPKYKFNINEIKYDKQKSI